jgi:hypothetical protein
MPKGIQGYQKGHPQFNSGRTQFKKGHKGLKIGEKRPEVTGEKHGMWKGGISKNMKEYSKKYWVENKDKKSLTIRKCNLRREFGLTLEQYDEMLKSQDNKCAICLVDQKENTRRFAVDHNHITNKIRGLLCMQCNSMLGLARESKETLERAIAYLGR